MRNLGDVLCCGSILKWKGVEEGKKGKRVEEGKQVEEGKKSRVRTLFSLETSCSLIIQERAEA